MDGGDSRILPITKIYNITQYPVLTTLGNDSGTLSIFLVDS